MQSRKIMIGALAALTVLLLGLAVFIAIRLQQDTTPPDSSTGGGCLPYYGGGCVRIPDTEECAGFTITCHIYRGPNNSPYCNEIDGGVVTLRRGESACARPECQQCGQIDCTGGGGSRENNDSVCTTTSTTRTATRTATSSSSQSTATATTASSIASSSSVPTTTVSISTPAAPLPDTAIFDSNQMPFVAGAILVIAGLLLNRYTQIFNFLGISTAEGSSYSKIVNKLHRQEYSKKVENLQRKKLNRRVTVKN